MPTNITEHKNVLATTYVTHAQFRVKVSRTGQAHPQPDAFLIVVEVVKVLLPEHIFIPLELLEQQQTPSLIEVDQHPDLLEDAIKFLENFLKRKYLVWLLDVDAVVLAIMMTNRLVHIRVVLIVIVVLLVIIVVVLVLLHAS